MVSLSELPPRCGTPLFLGDDANQDRQGDLAHVLGSFGVPPGGCGRGREGLGGIIVRRIDDCSTKWEISCRRSAWLLPGWGTVPRLSSKGWSITRMLPRMTQCLV